jgi:SMI1-KNR4 cell-wall
MKITLKNGKKISESVIADVETKLGFRLSESYKNFTRENDGAEPETNIFKINEKTDCGVNKFIPVSKIVDERQWVGNLPSTGYPVAWAEGGNYVFIDEGKKGEVYFWDHELPEQITKVGNNFEAFISNLEPFDTESIKLRPGQVKSAWIDPDFLKNLKEKK